MDINNYMLYSAISRQENLTQCDYSKVLEVINQLDSFEDGSAAMQYLNEHFRIKDSISNFPIYGNGVLNYSEFEKSIEIEVVYEKNHKVFCFNK